MRSMVVAFTLMIALAACKTKQPAAREVTPPTAAEAEAFGKQFATALGKCDANELDRLLDINLVIARAVAHRRLTPNEVEGMSNGIGKFGDRLCKELGGAGGVTVTYMRTRVIEGAPRPLLRLAFTESGVNYYELELDKRDGTIKAGDIFIFLLGEKLSDGFGRAIDAIMKSPSSSHMGTITRVKTHMRDGEWEQARQQFETLPAVLRQSKPLRLMELQFTPGISDDAYLASMESYAKAFPDDPSLALIQIDRLILTKQWAELLLVIDKLDKLLGGDPYLDVMRVDALVQLGKPAEAVAAAKRAVSAEPSIELVWWNQMTAHTANDQQAEAIATLETLRDKFNYEVAPDQLLADERYTKLVESDTFKTWLAAQTK